MGEEARTGKRFPIELPIKIHKGETDAKGVTGNLSAAGVYIRADETGEGGEGRGVACVIDSYEFVRNS